MTPSEHLLQRNFAEHTRALWHFCANNVVEANDKLNNLLLSLQALLNNEGCNLSISAKSWWIRKGRRRVCCQRWRRRRRSSSALLTRDWARGTCVQVCLAKRYLVAVRAASSSHTLDRHKHQGRCRASREKKRVDQRQIVVLVLLSYPSSVEAMNAAFSGCAC